MWVCTSVCGYVCVYICMYVHTYICTDVCVCVCVSYSDNVCDMPEYGVMAMRYITNFAILAVYR
jgi:hypothetical protein